MVSFLGSLGLGWVLGAVVVYAILLLAHLSGDSGRSPLLAARRPALWAALLALYCGGVIGSDSGLDRLRGARGPSTTERITGDLPFLEDLALTASPFLAISGIYVLAQTIGLRGRGSVRTADLAVRRLRDYLPPRLTVFTVVLIVLGAGCIVATSWLPAIVPDTSSLDGGGPVPPARMAGSRFAAIAGMSYALFVLTVIGALLVIVRRRRVFTLTHPEDSLIRRVHINRLLRTVAFVAVTVANSCLWFASTGDTAEIWNTLRAGTAALGLITVIVIIAAKPPQIPEDVDQQVVAPVIAPSGTTDRAVQVILSGRRIGYAIWALCILPLLFTVSELGGLLPLAVLVIAYAGFLLAQLVAELAVAQNHGDQPRPGLRNIRRLPVSLLFTAVPAVLLIVLAGVTSSWVGTLPGSSSELPFWSAAFWPTVAFAALVVVFSGARPPLRLASPAEDDALRGASVRRGLLMVSSMVLAFTGFLLSENRHALAGGSWSDQPGTEPFPFEPGQLQNLVLLLLVTAVVIAVLPGRRVPARAPQDAGGLRRPRGCASPSPPPSRRSSRSEPGSPRSSVRGS
ncbi:hypothetical protein AC792_03615 [Arthrobacter sp. RIT-PI-e]|uniref:hypothetical protein n=1 Tax=Arthrobacter sp. RIT-PI-e TaxID=1681197 RepID=UPI00067659CC|nr:hypothetical protein [Arthrobacter sp. RIT-PI-e]KNC19963.1 hypothetical protein AC792_03615 [Arthrobacter sp. RIT-PI-e]